MINKDENQRSLFFLSRSGDDRRDTPLGRRRSSGMVFGENSLLCRSVFLRN